MRLFICGTRDHGRRTRTAQVWGVALLALVAFSSPKANLSPNDTVDMNPPPKASWRARASHDQEPQFPPAHAIDGRMNTRWSSPFSDPHWIEIDLGRPSLVGGVSIHWETAHGSDYSILTSLDARDWTEVYSTDQGQGYREDIYFEPVTARYVRMHGRRRGTSWGYSIWQLDIYGPSQLPIIRAPSSDDTPPNRMMNGRTDTVWTSKENAPLSIMIDLQTTKALGGLRIDWGDNHATTIRQFLSMDGTTWTPAALLEEGTGQFDILLHPPRNTRFIRLDMVDAAEDAPIEIRELTLRDAARAETPMTLYQLAAAKAPDGLYPESLHQRQVYWTVVGLPDDHQESLIDEYGNMEPFFGGPIIMPYVREGDRLHSALNVNRVEQRLEDGYLPLPGVKWVTERLTLDIEALTRGQIDIDSTTYVRYRLANRSNEDVEGSLYLTIRPVQINPIWQHGGLSPIRAITHRSVHIGEVVNVHDRPLLVAFDRADTFRARGFLRGDIMEDIRRNRMPDTTALKDDHGMLSGTLTYPYKLVPGENKDVVIALPLHRRVNDLTAFLAGHDNPSVAFDSAHNELITTWRGLIDKVTFDLPDRAVSDTVKSQVAYILINRDGPAIQPGSRNYKRSWMRDGCLTSAALLRMGAFDEVREYLDWYAATIYDNGMVPPILNNDGTTYTGYGSDLEYDSQGQFIYTVMEYYRMTKDLDYLKQHFDSILRVMEFMVELRLRTLEPGYMAGVPGRDRFIGIFPPSISHEGYPEPMHSYWDTFWGLKGWKDGRDAAVLLERDDIAEWADSQYHALRKSVRATIDATLKHTGIDFIPGCSDKGDFDATSTAIAFFPCRVHDLLPERELQNTFDRYYDDLASRDENWVGAFTPYEVRSITAFIELGQKDRANHLLDFIMASRRPPAWNHLGEVVISEYRKGNYIGDMPHTWVGAGFVNSVRNMVVREIHGRLELLAGTRQSWVTDGDGIQIEGLPTHFGTLDMSAKEDGSTLTITLAGDFEVPERIDVIWPRDTAPTTMEVDGEAWTDFDDQRARLPASARRIRAVWE